VPVVRPLVRPIGRPLQAALEDVDRDLAVSDTPDDVREALAWLRENAEPVAACWIEPRGTRPDDRIS
jgi:hypothetical protein